MFTNGLFYFMLNIWTFLNIYTLVSQEYGSQNLDHYLDDFFFAGESNTWQL